MRTEVFARLVRLARSMSMDGVCPWTDVQTPDSIIDHLREECDELSEAIQGQSERGDITSEAGDVLMLALLLCFLLERDGTSSVEAIVKEVEAKLRRRSPHVFDLDSKISLEEAEALWELAKQQEKAKK